MKINMKKILKSILEIFTPEVWMFKLLGIIMLIMIGWIFFGLLGFIITCVISLLLI